MKIGRMRRLDYGLWMLALLVVDITLYIFLSFIGNGHVEIGAFAALFFIAFFVVYTVVKLFLVIARFHDIGKSGWFSLFTLIPIVSCILILILMFIKGDVGENIYGEDPKLKSKK